MSSTSEIAPLWLLFGVQLVSVIGDTFGQRCNRVVHGGSRRLFMFSMTIVTCLQMLVVLGAMQLIWPDLVTGINRKITLTVNETIFNSTTNESINTTVNETKTVDVCKLSKDDPNYDHEACYPQGPLTLYKVFRDCPYIFLNGVMNILYYVSEASLYREPAGIVLLVIAALASSFLINPFQHIFDVGTSAPLRPATIIFGIIGAILCVIERDPSSSKKNQQQEQLTDSTISPSDVSLSSNQKTKPHDNDVQDETQMLVNDNNNNNDGNSTISKLQQCCHWMKISMRVFPMFALLSICYSMWFVLLKLFNQHCSLNEWGYNSADQVPLPLFLLPLLAVWDCLRDKCNFCVDDDVKNEETLSDIIDQHNNNNRENYDDQQFVDTATGARSSSAVDSDNDEDGVLEKSSNFDNGHSNFFLTAKVSLKRSARNYGSGFAQMFVYRFFINARAIGYTVIANNYDLAQSYLELTLIRVLISWMSSLVCILLIPRFISATRREILVFKDWLNLALKFVGSVLVVVSLILMNKK